MLPVRAICVANADDKQAAPLPYTVCTRRCRLDLIDSPSQLFWVQPNLLLYGDDFRIFTVPVGGKPQLIGRQFGSFGQFSVDSAGDRVAAGAPSCPRCNGPVTVLDVPSGALVGRIGGKKVDNVTPSISPDGAKVVFARYTSGDSAVCSHDAEDEDGDCRERERPPGGHSALHEAPGDEDGDSDPGRDRPVVADEEVVPEPPELLRPAPERAHE